MDDGEVGLLIRGLGELAGERGREVGGQKDLLDRVWQHLELVRTWNEKVNLTAITGLREMIIKHVLDSSSVFGAVNLGEGDRVLDVGSGGGFPGITVKLLAPEVRMVLLESVRKKAEFLTESGLRLRLDESGFQVVWGRAEEWAHREGYREQFDVVMARAVAPLRVLVELCLPFCRNGGVLTALKGPGADDELGESQRSLDIIGGRVRRVHRVFLPEAAGARCVVVIEKVRSSPGRYPRRAGVPFRQPL